MENNRATTPLRYRFGNLTQARAHLREAEGRWLYFYRAKKLRLLPAAPVCLELGFDDHGGTRLLHGQVQGSLKGSGTWLEIADAAPLLSTARYVRASRRLGCDLPVEVRSEGRIDAGRLLDVSSGGARIVGFQPPATGQAVELRLLSPDRLTFRDLSFGHVAWTSGSGMGVRFDPTDSIGRIAASRLLEQVRARWETAWASEHPRTCCGVKGLIEPEPPQLGRPEDITSKVAL